MPIPVTLKCIQWNIERGYKLDDVIKALKNHYADIICLQELDINCERSGNRNCALEIAEALQMKCAFVAEFEEFHSPLRKPHLQGGGVHGNAILSRFDFEPRSWPHHHQPVDWDREGPLIGEPRRGARVVLAADIHVPGLDSPVLCYSLHFEVFTGIFGRIRQLADVFAHSKINQERTPRQLIFGDLNTMAHGIARLSSMYCRDGMRLGSLGYSEAAWWQKHILSHTQTSDYLTKYRGSPFSEEEISSLANPYFYDPFCVTKDTTLQGYSGTFTGKLDWTMLRGWHVLGKGMGNNHYKWSDHKLLYVILRPVLDDEGDIGKVAYDEYHVPLDHGRRVSYQAVMLGAMLGIASVSLAKLFYK
jgi:endonuclease/exonuclease/phosphatase family metal-dependent hydrolase